jgi:AraC-like DNA-binding protein
MAQLRETIDFGPGCFYRIERWNGDDRLIQVIAGPQDVRRIPAFGARWHYHRAIELTSILRGTSTCFVADRLQRFSAGELFVLGENIPHYWHHPRGSEGLSILWELPSGHGIWESKEIKLINNLAGRALRGLGIGGQSGQRICARLQELTRMNGLQRLGGLFQVLHEVLHADARDTSLVAKEPFSFSGSDEGEEAIKRALSYIHANYREPIVLTDLLSVTSMSRSTFTRKFHVAAQTCYTDYLNRIRLKAVCQELVSSQAPIGAIALNNGFTQISFFNRLFRRQMGESPSRYRVRNRGYNMSEVSRYPLGSDDGAGTRGSGEG